MSRGKFITFEGGEGAGKSTQVRRLVTRLQTAGLEVVATREPGGSAGAEAIRTLVLTGSTDRWSPVTETLLMYGARRDHIERTIIPALDRGAWVVCDRFADSTRAYQGGAGGVAPELIAALEDHVLAEVRPDLTLVFDLPVEVGLARAESHAAASGHAETRFESKGVAFHERLREAFQQIAAIEPDRCVLVNAADTMDGVESAIWTAVSARLRAHG
ncbi:dTMP kinase [Phenylobacterium sp. 20VBR1]|uniref:Thymidylate kinase n=1 Tax=Phenylobacterium glaciei TaxID=2803784 RepID=A0A941D1P0_9CAUL|nr:dTMP kinase [Phenylobacterium glaciei]